MSDSTLKGWQVISTKDIEKPWPLCIWDVICLAINNQIMSNQIAPYGIWALPFFLASIFISGPGSEMVIDSRNALNFLLLRHQGGEVKINRLYEWMKYKMGSILLSGFRFVILNPAFSPFLVKSHIFSRKEHSLSHSLHNERESSHTSVTLIQPT